MSSASGCTAAYINGLIDEVKVGNLRTAHSWICVHRCVNGCQRNGSVAWTYGGYGPSYGHCGLPTCDALAYAASFLAASKTDDVQITEIPGMFPATVHLASSAGGTREWRVDGNTSCRIMMRGKDQYIHMYAETGVVNDAKMTIAKDILFANFCEQIGMNAETVLAEIRQIRFAKFVQNMHARITIE